MVRALTSSAATSSGPGATSITTSITHHSSSSSSGPGSRVCPLKNACPDPWTWDSNDRSPEAMLVKDDFDRTVIFHPYWSNGTAGVRGTKPLNTNSVHYWEIDVSRRLFGTSLMFGIATKSARLHVDAFVNLLGENEQSWALSHKGTLWHNGRCRQFTEPFRENDATVIGLLYDGPSGSLAYFKDDVCLGVAFTELPASEPLYPAVCSTAAKTEMTLLTSVRSFSNLQDRCRASVVRHLVNGSQSIDTLPVPAQIKRYISELVTPSTVRERNVNLEEVTENRRQTGARLALKFPLEMRVTQRWPSASWLGDVQRS